MQQYYQDRYLKLNNGYPIEPPRTRRTCARSTYSLLAVLIILGVITWEIIAIAVILDYENTQNYIQNNCTNITNFRTESWNLFCNRAVATAYNLDLAQNVTLFYPPIGTFVIWHHSKARTWYSELQHKITGFTCFIDTPKNIGISQHYSQINIFYITSGIGVIVLFVSILAVCYNRIIQRNKSGYYSID